MVAPLSEQALKSFFNSKRRRRCRSWLSSQSKVLNESPIFRTYLFHNHPNMYRMFFGDSLRGIEFDFTRAHEWGRLLRPSQLAERPDLLDNEDFCVLLIERDLCHLVPTEKFTPKVAKCYFSLLVGRADMSARLRLLANLFPCEASLFDESFRFLSLDNVTFETVSNLLDGKPYPSFVFQTPVLNKIREVMAAHDTQIAEHIAKNNNLVQMNLSFLFESLNDPPPAITQLICDQAAWEATGFVESFFTRDRCRQILQNVRYTSMPRRMQQMRLMCEEALQADISVYPEIDYPEQWPDHWPLWVLQLAPDTRAAWSFLSSKEHLPKSATARQKFYWGVLRDAPGANPSFISMEQVARLNLTPSQRRYYLSHYKLPTPYYLPSILEACSNLPESSFTEAIWERLIREVHHMFYMHSQRTPILGFYFMEKQRACWKHIPKDPEYLEMWLDMYGNDEFFDKETCREILSFPDLTKLVPRLAKLAPFLITQPDLRISFVAALCLENDKCLAPQILESCPYADVLMPLCYGVRPGQDNKEVQPLPEWRKNLLFVRENEQDAFKTYALCQSYDPSF